MTSLVEKCIRESHLIADSLVSIPIEGVSLRDLWNTLEDYMYSTLSISAVEYQSYSQLMNEDSVSNHGLQVGVGTSDYDIG